MSTDEKEWDAIEAHWERAVERVKPEVERRIETSVMLELSIRAHNAQVKELERAMRALNMAVRRAQRSRRFARRAERLLTAAARLDAITNAEPLIDVARKALNAP